jgi:hypothetical protein
MSELRIDGDGYDRREPFPGELLEMHGVRHAVERGEDADRSVWHASPAMIATTVVRELREPRE